MKLTKRQRRVAELILEGKSNQEIADEMMIQEKSVRFHLETLYNLTGTHNRNSLFVVLLKESRVGVCYVCGK